MIAVIFEVWPDPNHKQNYLEVATALLESLTEVDGFISVERFESLTEEGKLLSLSFFEDENAIEQWRNLQEHRKAQALGRNRYFLDYRLRVAEVKRDYSKTDRALAPDDSKQVHRGK